MGTFPKLFAHRDALFRHLTTHWLRLVRPGRGRVRSRWPVDPTWALLQREFAALAGAPPLDEDGRELVRAHRHEGRRRLLERMALGVVKALEVEDASVAASSLAQLRQLAEAVAAREAERLERRRAAAEASEGAVPPWVERGMGAAAVERPDRARHLIQMLLGIFAAHGVLPLEFKPAHCVGDLLTQHLDALEVEADEKGGMRAVLAAHFARIYKRALPPELTALSID